MQSHENPQKTTSATVSSNTTTEAATDELTVHVPARWGDMDAYGHVNNVAMLSIMEEARVALFGPPPSSGEKPTVAPNPPIPLFDLVPEGVQALIAEHGIRYLAQLPYTGEPVPVRARLHRAGLLGLHRWTPDSTQPRATRAAKLLPAEEVRNSPAHSG